MWQVIEEPSYAHSVAQIGEMEDIDNALSLVIYALHRNPTGFHRLPNTRSIYVAKTKLRIVGLVAIPAYRLFVRVDHERRIVFKLWVEHCPPTEMSYGDSFNDDEDDIPF